MARAGTIGSDAEVSWGQAVKGVRLGLAPHGAEVGLFLQNVGEATIEVLSHVEAGEVQLDWYTLHLENEQGAPRTLRLLDARDESSIVRAQLAPGGQLSHRVAVAAWAARPINGGQQLAPGTYQVSAAYVAPQRGETWSGQLEAGPVQWTLDPTTTARDAQS